MKVNLLLFAFSYITFGCFAQGNNGLVAHWNFNGNTNDISGNGLNGIGTNVTSTVGYNGIANTAYQFNGDSSRIDVAYNSLLNLDSVSIFILLKPMGFYNGPCQVNQVFSRGAYASTDYYAIDFQDNDYDNDCSIYTLSHEPFDAAAHSITYPSNPSWYSNSDTVTLNTWYCITATYSQDSIRLYIDGTLRMTKYSQDDYAPTIDSLGIGYFAPGLNTGYPYWFKGTIDDIRLYSRALSPAEVTEYCDSAQMLPTNEVSQITNVKPEIFIYPNPAHNNINIQLPDIAGTSDIQLHNTLGQMIFDMKPTGSSVNIDISILPSGLYFIKAECNGQSIVRKILKE